MQVPEQLAPATTDATQIALPSLTPEFLQDLSDLGFMRVGIMVAPLTMDGDFLLLSHNGSAKSQHNELGPLGETAQEAETLLGTLHRGIREELGVERPEDRDFYANRDFRYIEHAWPVGHSYPGAYAFAIAFPVYFSHEVVFELQQRTVGTDEINAVQVLPYDDLMGMKDEQLRPGTKDWAISLHESGLITPPLQDAIQRIEFNEIPLVDLRDIQL